MTEISGIHLNLSEGVPKGLELKMYSRNDSLKESSDFGIEVHFPSFKKSLGKNLIELIKSSSVKNLKGISMQIVIDKKLFKIAEIEKELLNCILNSNSKLIGWNYEDEKRSRFPNDVCIEIHNVNFLEIMNTISSCILKNSGALGKNVALYDLNLLKDLSKSKER